MFFRGLLIPLFSKHWRQGEGRRKATVEIHQCLPPPSLWNKEQEQNSKWGKRGQIEHSSLGIRDMIFHTSYHLCECGQAFYLSQPIFSFVKRANNILALPWGFAKIKSNSWHHKFFISGLKSYMYFLFQTTHTTCVWLCRLSFFCFLFLT